MECHVGWVMDSREHRSRTASVRWEISKLKNINIFNIHPFLWLLMFALCLLFSVCSSNASPSEGTTAVGNFGCTPQSLPKFQHPSHELLKENGFTQHVYHKYRRRCLNGAFQKTFFLLAVAIKHLTRFITIKSSYVLVAHLLQNESGWGLASLRKWTHCFAFGRSSWEITSTERCTRNSDSWWWRMERRDTGIQTLL